MIRVIHYADRLEDRAYAVERLFGDVRSHLMGMSQKMFMLAATCHVNSFFFNLNSQPELQRKSCAD
jgi:hypothetical protein